MSQTEAVVIIAEEFAAEEARRLAETPPATDEVLERLREAIAPPSPPDLPLRAIIWPVGHVAAVLNLVDALKAERDCLSADLAKATGLLEERRDILDDAHPCDGDAGGLWMDSTTQYIQETVDAIGAVLNPE